MREHSNVCWYGQRGASGHSVDHQFGRKLRRAPSHCSRGLVVKIVRYKNIELTLTTRQLHSCELYAAGALRTARPTQSKVRVSPISHTFLLHEHGPVTRRAASGVAFVRVLGPVEERPVADQEKAGQEKPRIRDHESKFQVVKLAGGSTNGMPRSMACSSEQEPNLVNMRLTTSRLFRTPGRIANHLLIIGETSLQRTIRTWQKARSALQNRSAGLDKHSPPGLDRP